MWVSLHPLGRYLIVLKSAYRHSNELPFKLLSCERCFYHNTRKKEELVHCPERVKDKIIYNTLITPKHFLDVIRERKHVLKNSLKKKGVNNPISVKLLDNHVDCTESIVCQPDNKSSVSKSYSQSKPKLPFKYSIAYDVKILDVDVEKEEEPRGRPGVSIESVYADDAIKGSKSWMNDYEKYCNVDSDTGNEDSDWLVNYGTPDTEVPISDVGCGGCGAYLHCKEPSLPGYLPSEIFLECTRKDLESVLCQRCHFLKHYNTALSVHVNPDQYINLISRIKSEALVLLLVDLTDTAGSVWPEITDIMGKNRPIILIGNKVDLLWGDRPEWLNHVEKALRKCLPNSANVLDMCLISAKTGFGVEELVSKLHSVWRNRNDVYLVGCTNVGKSTLFNALIQSDYCKTKAVDLVQRATTAPWPGTTLNLLKFPILRPTAWKLHVRNVRLNLDRSRSRRESELRKLQMRVQRKKQVTPPQLIGHIAHSFKEFPDGEDQPDMFNLPSTNVRNFEVEDQRISLVNKEIKEFEEGRWFFDTPGVLHKDQILNLLTAEELLITIPRDLIEPRTFLLHQGMSLFIAGLSRFDYVQGERPIRVTVFSSDRLPITICAIQHSCTVYEALLGSELTLVPLGSASRLSEWPGLSASDTITLCGVGSDESCADVMFSSTGWIAVTPEKNEICKFIAWSPMRRGISVRHPPLLPLAVKRRGKKMHKSLAYSRTSNN